MNPDGDFVVASTDGFPDANTYADSCGGTQVQRFSRSGQRSSPLKISDESCSWRPVVAIEPDGDFVVAFGALSYDKDCGFDCPSYVGVRRYRSNGQPLDTADIHVVDAPGEYRGYREVSDVAIDGSGNFVVTWSETVSPYTVQNVFMRSYSSSGIPNGPALQMNALGSGLHIDPVIGFAADGSLTAAWQRQSTNGQVSDVFWRSFRPDGTPTRDVHTRVNTTTDGYQSSPAIVVSNEGGFVIAWHSEDEFGGVRIGETIYAQRFAGNAPPPPALPTVSFARAAQAVDESAGLVNVRVTLSAVSASPVTVPLRLGGTATRNSDYRLPGNSVVIPAGARFANVPVTIINDRKREPRESLTLTMGKPANATKGAITGFELAIKKSD